MLALPDPADPERHSGLIVLGMGKLGGGRAQLFERYRPHPALRPGAERASLARDGAQPFFSRLARDLVRILEERTGDGYVFRTDLRLRPDPRSTPLAMSVAAALGLLRKRRPELGARGADQGAPGRRRPRSPDRRLSRASCARLSGASISISRRSQDIHSIKRQIHAHRGGGRIAVEGHDIKIGRGGIREIEFFAQTQQLIWGGRLPRAAGAARPARRLRRLAACRPHRPGRPRRR